MRACECVKIVIPESQCVNSNGSLQLITVVKRVVCCGDVFHGMSSFSGKDRVRLSDLGGGCTANYGSSARPLRYSVNLSVSTLSRWCFADALLDVMLLCGLVTYSGVRLLCGLVDLSCVIMLCGLVRNYPIYG